jgi:hypothetical protein
MNDRPNIVLIHAAWADGYCWSGVIERLPQPLATFALGDVMGVPAELLTHGMTSPST